jgi:hypothetical protein
MLSICVPNVAGNVRDGPTKKFSRRKRLGDAFKTERSCARSGRLERRVGRLAAELGLPQRHRSTTSTSTTRVRKRQLPLTTTCQPTRLLQPPNGLPFSCAALIDREHVQAEFALKIAPISLDAQRRRLHTQVGRRRPSAAEAVLGIGRRLARSFHRRMGENNLPRTLRAERFTVIATVDLLDPKAVIVQQPLQLNRKVQF